MQAKTKIERIASFVDGFNLYHALKDLGRPELKWLDLWKLSGRFAAQEFQELTRVYYFSAFATWLPDSYRRHRQYVKALETCGVTPIMGRFKEKDQSCFSCGARWKTHEEKETDVNLALFLLNEARKDTYDHAFIISNDSDLVPAVKMVRQEFPHKRIRILTPPGKRTSMDLVRAAGGKKFVRTIKESQISKLIMPVRLSGRDGEIVRPDDYSPQ